MASVVHFGQSFVLLDKGEDRETMSTAMFAMCAGSRLARCSTLVRQCRPTFLEHITLICIIGDWFVPLSPSVLCCLTRRNNEQGYRLLLAISFTMLGARLRSKHSHME